MKRTLFVLALSGIAVAAWLMAQPSGDPLIEGFRTTEVASVADAMEQLYGTRGYMSHEMRPLFTTKFAGPAVTVMLKKEEHKEGAAASSGMLDAIDSAAPGTVYVMVLDKTLPSPLAPHVMATVHPSSLLRAPDAKTRAAEFARLVAELRRIAAFL